MKFNKIACLLSMYVEMGATLAHGPQIVEWDAQRMYGPDGPWRVLVFQIAMDSLH